MTHVMVSGLEKAFWIVNYAICGWQWWRLKIFWSFFLETFSLGYNWWAQTKIDDSHHCPDTNHLKHRKHWTILPYNIKLFSIQ